MVKLHLPLVALYLSACVTGQTSTQGGPFQSVAGPDPLETESSVPLEAIAAMSQEDFKSGVDELPEARAFESEVFADGVVTFDEYEAAILAGIACVRDLGIRVEGPTTYPNGGVLMVGRDPTLSLDYVMMGDIDEQLLARADGCQFQWAERITLAWLDQTAPTSEEQEVWREAARECAVENRIALPEPASDIDLISVVIQDPSCRPWEAMK